MPAPYDKADFNPFQTMGYEQLNVTSVAVGLTSTIFRQPTSGGQAKMAMITIENFPVRYRADGTAPTTAVGTLLQPNDQIIVYGGADINNMRLIAGPGATSATANVEYLR